jgi:hypothetical protein
VIFYFSNVSECNSGHLKVKKNYLKQGYLGSISISFLHYSSNILPPAPFQYNLSSLQQIPISILTLKPSFSKAVSTVFFHFPFPHLLFHPLQSGFHSHCSTTPSTPSSVIYFSNMYYPSAEFYTVNHFSFSLLLRLNPPTSLATLSLAQFQSSLHLLAFKG